MSFLGLSPNDQSLEEHVRDAGSRLDHARETNPDIRTREEWYEHLGVDDREDYIASLTHPLRTDHWDPDAPGTKVFRAAQEAVEEGTPWVKVGAAILVSSVAAYTYGQLFDVNIG